MAKYIMVSSQLKAGDVITEAGILSEQGTREVQVTGVESGEIQYRDGYAPVWFVTGYDLRSSKLVRWTATNWRRWLAERTAA
jgi:hypothetical protein